MTRFKFAQMHWLKFIFIGFFSSATFRWLQNQVSISLVILLSLAIGILTIFLLDRFFTSVVEFKDSYLLYKRGLLRKDVVVDYAAINKITFTYDRFLDLHIYTEGSKIKLPSPGRLPKVEELFRWLSTQNPSIETEIIRKKSNDA